MEISVLNLEKLYFVILTFNCFCADQGNKMLLLVKTSTAINTIPTLFRGLGTRPAMIVFHRGTLVCVTFQRDITSPPSQPVFGK